MQPTFDLGGLADIEVLLGMMRKYYASDRVPFHPDRARQSVERLVQDPTLGRVWLIRRQQTAVGYACLCLGFSLEFGRDAFLDEIFVEEMHRGQGIGRAAIEYVAAACRDLGVQALHLVVAPHNNRAYQLYSRIGFEDQERSMMTRRIQP